jgi:hypothetical protein
LYHRAFSIVNLSADNGASRCASILHVAAENVPYAFCRRHRQQFCDSVRYTLRNRTSPGAPISYCATIGADSFGAFFVRETQHALGSD